MTPPTSVNSKPLPVLDVVDSNVPINSNSRGQNRWSCMKGKSMSGAEEVFTPEFLDYVVEACDKFAPVIADIRTKRDALLQRALKSHKPPTFPLNQRSTPATGRSRLRPMTCCGSLVSLRLRAERRPLGPEGVNPGVRNDRP